MGGMSAPNILLLMTDQQRGDALGIEGHPDLETPYLDHLAATGARFRHAYSPCPVCMPARRSLMTGCTPATHGTFNNYGTHLDQTTLPEVLSRHGYQTHLCGKLHLWPEDRKYGFESWDRADGTTNANPRGKYNDFHHAYDRFLRAHGVDDPDLALANGVDPNGWTARPWHLDESLHYTNWCSTAAIEFLQRRDTTRPFFLKVSYVQPHQPLCPPRWYFDKYMARDLAPMPVADWARVYDGPQKGLPVASWRVQLNEHEQKQFMAGYYGCINHIDDQIGRLLRHVPQDTLILFCSDHGEMLGEHQWMRKRSAFEGSARVPFLVRPAPGMGLEGGQVREEPVSLIDILPTCLEAAGAEVPAAVDGKSVLPLLRGQTEGWRDMVHGECCQLITLNSGMQYLTNGREKYIYYPGNGEEQFFDLEKDPREMENLASTDEGRRRMAPYRERLVQILDGRPEGFVQDGQLQVLGDETEICLPAYRRH